MIDGSHILKSYKETWENLFISEWGKPKYDIKLRAIKEGIDNFGYIKITSSWQKKQIKTHTV